MNDILEELVTKFTYDVDDAGLRKYLRGQEKINRNTKTMIGLNTTLSRVMRRIFFGAGAIMGVNSLVQTYRNFDIVQRSLNALTGSAEEGAEHFEFLKRAAFQTGTGIMEVAKAYRGYYYAAKTAGLTNEELQHSFFGVMVGARVLGANKQQVGGAMLALEQMLNKTTVQAQELNLQLGNAISGAKEMAAEAMGMSVSEFVEKMQKKMINAAEFVRKFGDYMYKQFIGRLPEAMKSLDASIINMENAWLIFQNEIMKGGLGEELTKLTGEIMKLLLSPEAKSFAQAIGGALNMVGKALSFIVKHFKAILFFWGVSSIIRGIVSLSALRWKILDIATTIDSSLYPATSKIIYALRDMLFYGKGLTPVLQSVGKAALMVGKNFLWVTAIVAALYGLYLILEDIYTYFTHPEWDSFTKDLVESSPKVKEMIEEIKQIIKEIKPDIEELKNSFNSIMGCISDFLKNTNAIENSIKTIIKVVIWLTNEILKLIEAAYRVQQVLNPFSKTNKETGNKFDEYEKEHGVKIGKSFRLGTRLLGIGLNEKIPAPLRMPFLASGGLLTAMGSNNLTKTENTTKTITNTFQINAQNRTDAEIMAIIQKAIGGEIDTAYDLLNPTSYLDAEKRRVKK